ncbi:unnamed protein product [Prorocentrum cordatum]|uniref:Uncharacterized protein n=1 Tax=Prorocentrum cordatum TaxID=2364126 RepID=A0ABN9SV79_9DINO|nr:unnamed protein product [Polarella glacialis]
MASLTLCRAAADFNPQPSHMNGVVCQLGGEEVRCGQSMAKAKLDPAKTKKSARMEAAMTEGVENDDEREAPMPSWARRLMDKMDGVKSTVDGMTDDVDRAAKQASLAVKELEENMVTKQELPELVKGLLQEGPTIAGGVQVAGDPEPVIFGGLKGAGAVEEAEKWVRISLKPYFKLKKILCGWGFHKRNITVDDENAVLKVGGTIVAKAQVHGGALAVEWPSTEWKDWKELQDSQELKDLIQQCQTDLASAYIKQRKGLGMRGQIEEDMVGMADAMKSVAEGFGATLREDNRRLQVGCRRRRRRSTAPSARTWTRCSPRQTRARKC